MPNVMGTSDDQRRRLGRAAEFMMMMMLMMVGSSLSQAVPTPSPCPGVQPHTMQPPAYEESLGPVGDFMSTFVQSFLNTVQPKSFPKDLVGKVVQDYANIMTNQEFIKEILMYELGFLVCVAIGLLYIVLMPIVGFFLACCRYCGKCGGKMYQKQTSSIRSRRRRIYGVTFVTTVVLVAGNICMFKSNDALKASLESTEPELNKILKNVNTFITAVPQQAQFVINESFFSIQEVAKNLDAIGPQFGVQIQKQFEPAFTPALQSLISMDHEVVNTDVLVNKLNTSLASLQSSVNVVQSDTANVRNQINQTLSQPACVGCAAVMPELNKLTMDATINVSILNELEKAINEMIQADLNSKVQEVKVLFQDLPAKVTNETKGLVQSTKNELDKVKSQISNLTTQLPVSSLSSVLSQLDKLQDSIGVFSPQVERAENIRWSVCISLCCVILLVVVCNISGLLMGPLGLTPNVEPTKRSCTSHCGGTFLMMGVGFSFLISWLFMILVLVLFVVGGNVYMLVCKPWHDGELLKLIDTPGLLPGFDLSATLGFNISISGLYQDCKENKPAWSVFQLNQLIDLDDLFNISKYTGGIANNLDNINITLSPLTFLTPGMKTKLNSFSSNANDIDFASPVQQLNRFSSINFNTTADTLDNLATGNTGTIQTELTSEAQSLRRIQAEIETDIYPKLATVNATIKKLKTAVGEINATVGELLRNVAVAQDFFDKNATEIVKSTSREFLDCQLGHFTAYADWAKTMIKQQVGNCGPVAGALDSAENIVCSNIVESLNAFWFSLGWCMMFLIPSIITSIKLAKFYRKMKFSDVFDEPVNTKIPRPQMNIS